MPKRVLIIGGGLAGVEAACFLADRDIDVILCECKRIKKNPAQKLDDFAELVCSNSLKSMRPETPHGLLKYELEGFGSLMLDVALEVAVPAGTALAVDRELFSRAITHVVEEHPHITVVEEEIVDPLLAQKRFQADLVILASGPLTTAPLQDWICQNIAGQNFHFYDAIAPIVDASSLDYSKIYSKNRTSRSQRQSHASMDTTNTEIDVGDYLNVPLDKAQYESFVAALVSAEKVPLREFEEKTASYFESCLPIDLMAERGPDTLRFSCMRPIGLEMENGELPYAVIQLRKENLSGEAYNLVGFQTRLTYGEQKRIFSTLPGFENAKFLTYGSVHRNSFVYAKEVLKFDFSTYKHPDIYMAGQMTGVEGYTESALSGIYVAFQVWRRLGGLEPVRMSPATVMGALVEFLMSAPRPTPTNINFGIMPKVELTPAERRGKDPKQVRNAKIVLAARKAFDQFVVEFGDGEDADDENADQHEHSHDHHCGCCGDDHDEIINEPDSQKMEWQDEEK